MVKTKQGNNLERKRNGKITHFSIALNQLIKHNLSLGCCFLLFSSNIFILKTPSIEGWTLKESLDKVVNFNEASCEVKFVLAGSMYRL